MPKPGGNAAIGFNERATVGDVLLWGLDDTLASSLGEEQWHRVQEIANRLKQPGPPLVSAADVAELIDLIAKLHAMKPGDELDHHWCGIKLEGIDEQGHYHWRVTAPGHLGAVGNGHYGTVHGFAQAMYEQHLKWRGLVP